MNKATLEILSTLALTGTAVVSHHKKNEMKALQELKTKRIVFEKEIRIGYSIVKFGYSEWITEVTNSRTYTPTK